MTYQTTITKKGQITVPKPFRDALHLTKNKKLMIDFEERKGEIRIKPAHDFLEVARSIKVRRKMDVVKAREYMEKHYVERLEPGELVR